MTTVVLGWDGLDHSVVSELGLADAFGPHTTRIESYDNDKLGKPHTYEVWPSIITGVHSDEHGIEAISADDGAEWRHPVLDRASTAAQSIVPESVRTWIGRQLRQRGAQLDMRTPEYYRENGLRTVFDDRAALPLAIPNYRNPVTESLGLLHDRAAQMAAFLETEKTADGGVRHTPKQSLEHVEKRIVGQAGKKVAIVRASLVWGYDIVFVWLALLDTVGHMAPAIQDETWTGRNYRTAAAMTELVRAGMDDGDHLVCVSDHGLTGGNHTHDAFLGATNPIPDDVNSVLDVAKFIDGITPTHGDGGENPSTRADATVADETMANLEDLGYL